MSVLDLLIDLHQAGSDKAKAMNAKTIFSPGATFLYAAALTLAVGIGLGLYWFASISVFMAFAGGILLRVDAHWNHENRPPLERLWTPRARWGELDSDASADRKVASEDPRAITALGLTDLLRRSRPYGIRVVCFAGRPGVEKLVDMLIEDKIVATSERQAVVEALVAHAVDIRGLPAESAVAAITG